MTERGKENHPKVEANLVEAGCDIKDSLDRGGSILLNRVAELGMNAASDYRRASFMLLGSGVTLQVEGAFKEEGSPKDDLHPEEGFMIRYGDYVVSSYAPSPDEIKIGVLRDIALYHFTNSNELIAWTVQLSNSQEPVKNDDWQIDIEEQKHTMRGALRALMRMQTLLTRYYQK